MPTRLEKIHIEGFRSIQSCELELTNLNVLIGANGAGKSNLISLFSMLRAILDQSLQSFIAKSGTVDSILFYGPKRTKRLELRLEFNKTRGQSSEYSAVLSYAPTDKLIFDGESVNVTSCDSVTKSKLTKWISTNQLESSLGDPLADKDDPVRKELRALLRDCCVFHFHDTTPEAPIRRNVNLDDNSQLHGDGANLAAFLYRLQQQQPEFYSRIVATIRQVVPYFKDFILEPLELNPNYTSLRWRDGRGQYQFGPHQHSDGALRAIALIALLQQPEKSLPKVIVLDEPELGLHPAAMSIICALIKQASHHAQIILATQSPYMVNQFSPEDIIVVERENDASVFRHLDPEQLKGWLEDYSLAELWDKNVFGGRPQ